MNKNNRENNSLRQQHLSIHIGVQTVKFNTIGVQAVKFNPIGVQAVKFNTIGVQAVKFNPINGVQVV